MLELVETDRSGFKWGKFKCLGVNKSFKFYYAFTLDGVEYALYDAVYMFDEREDYPHVGLVIKIWEGPSGNKKVKVLWFFRPWEIRNFITEDVAENELFLASGEGIGLTNINPLEAISGKCNVVCIKEDSRAKFQSGIETKNADYFVCRTFDVARRIVSAKIDDKIAGIEASVLLSRICSQESHPLNHSLKEKSTEGVDQSNVHEKNAIMRKISDALERTDDQNLCDKTAEHVANEHSLPEDSKQCHSIGLEISESGTSGENKNVLVASNEKVNEQAEGVPNANVTTSKRTENKKSNKSHLKKKQKLDNPINAEVTNVRQRVMKNPVSDSFGNKGADKDAENKAPETTCAPSVLPNERNNDALQASSLRKDSCKGIDTKKKSDQHKIDKSKWFKLPWDERMKMCNEQGRLVLLCNFDSSFSGSEVEEIIQKAFNLSCSARIIPHTTCSSPNFGQAFVTFMSKKAAETVVTKLTEDCLVLSTGRPLLASFVSPCFPATKELLCGHFVHDKAKYQLQKDMLGGSICHFSQPNTIEFEMAKEWYLLHARSDAEWKSLYKHQANDLRNFKAS